MSSPLPGGAVLQILEAMTVSLDALLLAIDPSALTTREAASVLKAAAALERRAATLKTLVAARAAESSEWANSGHRSPESWLGAVTGSGFGEAAATLNASNRLEELPGVSDAARKGELSGPQLRELGSAATEDNESELLDAAKKGSVDQLRKTCQRAKAAKRPADEERRRAERIHRERYFKSWTDSEGAYRFEGKGTAADGARIEAAMGAATDRVFKQAWKEGRRERLAAYRFDALVELLANGGGGKTDTHVVIRVDASRLAGDDGVCETSTGTVPAEDAIGAILAGAFIKIVLRDGVDISKVSHHRRHIPAELRTAVMERDGFACVRCGATQRLQIHHYKIDFADPRGKTAYWNLATLCRHDHDLVTNGGHQLAGGPGEWKWIVPR